MDACIHCNRIGEARKMQLSSSASELFTMLSEEGLLPTAHWLAIFLVEVSLLFSCNCSILKGFTVYSSHYGALKCLTVNCVYRAENVI